MNWKFWTWQWPQPTKKRVRIPHKKSWWNWLLSRTIVYDALVALFVCLGGLANGLRAKKANEMVPARLWFTTALGGMVFTVIRAYVVFSESVAPESTHELFGCVHVLHGQLSEPGLESRLRVTLYVPLPGQAVLQQVVEYVGDSDDAPAYKSGRTMPAFVGIVGRAYRTKQYVIAERQGTDLDEFRKELIRDWSYTEEGAAEIDPESQCWVAVPIILAGEVLAVLFADSTERQFFDDDRLRLMLGASAGIATFVEGRYK